MDKEILLLDGGLGTTLEDQHGVEFSHETPLWSSHLLISDPDTLRKVQRNFANAGADVILTPTYQASHVGFQKTGVQNPSNHFKMAVQISRDTGKLVALSLGAYGAIMQPSQEYSGNYGIGEAELKTFHAQRLAEFDGCKVDVVAFETLPRLDEVRAVKATIDNRPYWIACVFPDGKLPDGSTVEELVKEMMMEPRPWAIGMNCTKLDKIRGLIAEFEEAATKLEISLPRLVMYPDGTNGLVYDTTKQKWVGEEHAGPAWDEQVADIVKEVQRRHRWEGIVVGGCCKTTPEHIAKLRKRLDGS